MAKLRFPYFVLVSTLTIIVFGYVGVIVIDIGKYHILTIDDLAKNPRKYEGRPIEVRGFCNIEFEGRHALYSKDFRILYPEEQELKAVWVEVDFNPFQIEECKNWMGSLIILKGVLKHTHWDEKEQDWGNWKMHQITAIQKWSPPF